MKSFKEFLEQHTEETVTEGSMPSSVIKHKQKMADMSPQEFAQANKDKSDDDLRAMAWRHGHGKGSNHYVEKRKRGQESMTEDWQDVNRKDKTDGLSQAAVNAYRRENPGSKLKTAVTEKNPKGKRAKRRKSFCSRMSGMKKRLTSAKNARDPDSPINKALRRWNC